jgi:hypothetical protein
LSPPSPGTRRPTASYRSVDVLFDEAVSRTGLIERHYEIARRPVVMRYAGPAMLERISRGFAHLEVESVDEPAITINLWDSASSGTERPPSLGEAIETPRESFDSGAPVYYFENDGLQALRRWETLSVYDRTTGDAWFWAPDPDVMLSWDWASPLRTILHWWLGSQGVLQVHGGAVGTESGGVLVVGRSGSGKSTTSLASLAAGLRYAGDDFVAVERRPEPWVHSLYNSGKLESHHIERFPSLFPGVVNPERDEAEKAIVYAEQLQPGVATAGFPLRAVLVPRIVGGLETRAVRASPGAALTALAPSTIFQLHPPLPNALAEMAELVRRVPCYSLELGTELERIPAAIVDLLERL